MIRPLYLLAIFAACGVETVAREERTPTPLRPQTIEADPSATEGDGDPTGKGKVGEAGEAPLETTGLTATALPAPTRKGVVLDVIRAAKETLVAGLYLMTDTSMAQAFVDAKDRGVQVRIVIDDSDNTHSGNIAALNTLTQGGVPFVKAKGFSYHHAKYVVADNKVALVMTCNFTNSSFNDNREVVVKVGDPNLISELSTVFDADYEGSSPEIAMDSPLVVSPINARSKIDGLLGNAQERIIVAMQSVDDNETVYRLIERKDAGLDVKVMIADPNVYGKSGDAQWLKDNGIAVRYLPESLLYLHEKVIIADDTSFVGSVNLTYTSITKNREIGVIGDATFTATVLPQVEADWDAAVPF